MTRIAERCSLLLGPASGPGPVLWVVLLAREGNFSLRQYKQVLVRNCNLFLLQLPPASDGVGLASPTLTGIFIGVKFC